MPRRTSSARKRAPSRRAQPRRRPTASRGPFFRHARTVAVLTSAALVFAAGLIFDTAAVLRLVCGWAGRVAGHAPLATAVVVMAAIAAALLWFGRGGAEAPAPQNRRSP